MDARSVVEKFPDSERACAYQRPPTVFSKRHSWIAVWDTTPWEIASHTKFTCWPPVSVEYAVPTAKPRALILCGLIPDPPLPEPSLEPAVKNVEALLCSGTRSATAKRPIKTATFRIAHPLVRAVHPSLRWVALPAAPHPQDVEASLS